MEDKFGVTKQISLQGQGNAVFPCIGVLRQDVRVIPQIKNRNDFFLIF